LWLSQIRVTEDGNEKPTVPLGYLRCEGYSENFDSTETIVFL
jgi:hypothetical protein